jgi:hypothetical protein
VLIDCKIIKLFYITTENSNNLFFGL